MAQARCYRDYMCEVCIVCKICAVAMLLPTPVKPGINAELACLSARSNSYPAGTSWLHQADTVVVLAQAVHCCVENLA
jgi:hypothetical protein